MKPAETDPNAAPPAPVPDYRPVERFWPYVNLPEQPTDAELAALNPELAEALFGAAKLPFSISLEFETFAGPDFQNAIAMARSAAEYRELRTGDQVRHRVRFYPQDVEKLRDLFEIVGRFDSTDVLVDDRPVPYARELWLPLMWFLIR
jgi:hypothetical protein